MNNVLEDSLFVSQTKKFDEIQSIVRQFSAEYVGNSIIKDNMCSAPMIKMLGMELQILKMFGASVWYRYSHV